jgi:PhnB protein
MKLNTYVNFAGNLEEAFRYYEQHLGAKTLFTMKWNQMPGPDAARHTPPGFENKVLHATAALGDTTFLAADVPGAEPMRSAYLTLSVNSNEEAERIYSALADGGQIFMAMGETFFAHRFGQLRDKFGINWMIIHDKPMPNA